MKKKFNLSKFADALALSMDENPAGVSLFARGKFTAQLYYPYSSYAVKQRARKIMTPINPFKPNNLVSVDVEKALKLYETHELAIETIKRHLRIQGEDLEPTLVKRASALILRLRYECRLKAEKAEKAEKEREEAR